MKVIEFKRNRPLSFGFNGNWLEIEDGSQVSITRAKAIEYAINFLDEKQNLSSGGFVSYGGGLYTFEHCSGDDMKLVIKLVHSEAYDLAGFIVENGND